MSLRTSEFLWNIFTRPRLNKLVLNFLRKMIFLTVSSDQSEAHRQKNKAARERRAQRVAAKKDAVLGPIEAAAPPVAEKKAEKAAKAKK